MNWISRHWRGVSIASIIVAAALAYWPALRSALVLDDYFLLAIARLTSNPFAPFLANHFPGGLFYRPLGIAFWWLSAAAFGHALKWHYVANLALHAGVGIALWRLLHAWTQSRSAALLAALAFVVHPLAIGTALWLSDRFDLLAALFGLLALHAAWCYREEGGRDALIASFAYAALAVWSKETGFAVFAPIAVLWLWPRTVAAEARFWSPPRRAACASIAFAAALLAWRAWILGGALATYLHQDVSVPQMFAEGIARWAEYFLAYAVQSPRLPRAVGLAVIVAAAGLAACASAGLVRRRSLDWRGDGAMLAAAAVALTFATAVLQAPTLRVTQIAMQAQDMPITVSASSRFFYLSLIGLAMFGAGLHSLSTSVPAPRSIAPARRFGAAVVALALICIIPWAWDSHTLARAYRRESFVQIPLIHAALDAVGQLPLPQEHCQIYLLDVPRERQDFFTPTADAAIKALSPDLARVQNCRVQTEAAPWFYILARGALTPDTAAPMRPIYLDGKRVPWREYGGVEVAYLNLLPNIDAKSIGGAIFLAYEQGRFVDVGAQVRSGRREVAFRCLRQPRNCIDSAAATADIPRTGQ